MKLKHQFVSNSNILVHFKALQLLSKVIIWNRSWEWKWHVIPSLRFLKREPWNLYVTSKVLHHETAPTHCTNDCASNFRLFPPTSRNLNEARNSFLTKIWNCCQGEAQRSLLWRPVCSSVFDNWMKRWRRCCEAKSAYLEKKKEI